MNRHYAFSSLTATLLAAALFAGCGASVVVPASISQTHTVTNGKLALVTIPAPSLANNVVGDPDKQQIAVWVPPSYYDSDRRYPVVYHLTAIGTPLDSPYGYPAAKSALDNLIASGKSPEMIVVTVSGFNALGASFYVNSPVTGNWEYFIAGDVVGYIDSHYRTLADPVSRGISGHSLGGNGAVNLAMRHPAVFGAVYALSPALFDSQGLEDSPMFASPEVIDDVLAEMDSLSTLPQDDAVKQFRSWYVAAGKGEKFTVAYGAAFSPALDKKPPYILYPYHKAGAQLVRDEAVWGKWESGYGGISDRISQYKTNLAGLKGIGLEYGQLDENAWIPRGCEYLSETLTSAGIAHTLATFQGGHFDQLSKRIEGFMLPFFAKELVFAEK